jgi:hypothetical protein
MSAQPEATRSAVSLLDEALADLRLVRTCLDELREPDAALFPTETLVGRAERCVDDVVATLRSLCIRVADKEAGP